MTKIYLSHILREDEPTKAWDGNEWGTTAAHFAAAAKLQAEPLVGYAPGYTLPADHYLSKEHVEALEPDPVTGGMMITLYVIERKCVGTLGHFPLFRINGQTECLDMSLPTAVTLLPRDARRLTPTEAAKVWHGGGDSHVFGDETNYGALLRTAIVSMVPQASLLDARS